MKIIKKRKSESNLYTVTTMEYGEVYIDREDGIDTEHCYMKIGENRVVNLHTKECLNATVIRQEFIKVEVEMTLSY